MRFIVEVRGQSSAESPMFYAEIVIAGRVGPPALQSKGRNRNQPEPVSREFLL
jgi:hypothetical protein